MSRKQLIVTRHSKPWHWCWLIIPIVLCGVACSSNPSTIKRTNDNASSPTGRPVPSTTMRDPQQQSAANAVVDAYRRFWEIATDVGNHPVKEWRPRLQLVATDPFLSELLDGLSEQRQRGVVDFGTVDLRPTVATFLPTRASIIDCQDASRSGEADRFTGEVKTVGSSHTAFTATLTRSSSGRWQVTQARYLPESC